MKSLQQTAFTLLFLAFPSLRLLYLMDEVSQPSVTVKTIGHQWYWRYEYRDFLNLEFDSYIIPTNDLDEGQFRLLEVDNRVVLPIGAEIRILVTSADVIHAWTIPSLGVKVDAIPGRLNQIGFISNRPGVFYGQCSEICGSNHRFIPIRVEFVNHSTFIIYQEAFCQVFEFIGCQQPSAKVHIFLFSEKNPHYNSMQSSYHRFWWDGLDMSVLEDMGDNYII